MKRCFALLLLLTSLSAVVYSQDKAPSMLYEAAQCLVTEKTHWVDAQGVKELSLGYLPDKKKTIMGDQYLYVIVFTTPHRDAGKVFDIRFKQEKHQRVYTIENNATFASTKKGIEYSEPPVGGTWAENQLTPPLEQILHHKKWYSVQSKSLLKPSSHLRCETSAETK
jgi:hypothetical protein